jgi:hypothetical protein
LVLAVEGIKQALLVTALIQFLIIQQHMVAVEAEMAIQRAILAVLAGVLE